MADLFTTWLHSISAALLLGVGLGNAFHLFAANRTRDTGILYFAAKYATILNKCCLLPAASVLLLCALAATAIAGQSFLFALAYSVILLGWIAATRLQTHMRNIAAVALADATPLPRHYWNSERLWCIITCLLLAAQLILLSLALLA
jgi:uncharacterized membrane protein